MKLNNSPYCHSLRSLLGLSYVKKSLLVCPFNVRSKSPVSNYHILIDPSSEEVANWVYWGWNAIDVTVALWPAIVNFAGVFGKYKSSMFMFLFPTGPPPLANSSSRLCTFSSRVDIFFWSERMDFHLIYSFLPSGSISSRLTSIYCAKTCAVFW